MKDACLAWEPESLAPLQVIEDRMMSFTNGIGGVTILKNGTVLFITPGLNDIEDAKAAMSEAKHLMNFRVVELKQGGYLVAFHQAVAVFVDDDEFEKQKLEIALRKNDLTFSGETFATMPDATSDKFLIGLYARGKLQRDAHQLSFYKRL